MSSNQTQLTLSLSKGAWRNRRASVLRQAQHERTWELGER
jgi:hypothetical protein